MESKTKWHSCRLAVHSDSGRVRWCVGHERTWQSKLKGLVFLPAVLLSIVLLSIVLSHFLFYHHHEERVVVERLRYEENDSLDSDEKRDVLKDTKTSYIPSDDVPLFSNEIHTRKKRDAQYTIPGTFQRYDKHWMFAKQRAGKRFYWKLPRQGSDVYSLQPDHVNGTTTEQQTMLPTENTYTSYERFWRGNLTAEEVRKIQAETMKSYMDLDINPCTNFYDFACGNWDKHNQMPADRTTYDTFEILRESLDSVLQDLLTESFTESQTAGKDNIVKRRRYLDTSYQSLENNTLQKSLYNETSFNDISAILKAKMLYKSCMNEDLLRQRGEKPLLKLLEDLGGWPVLDSDWDESQFDVIALMGQLRLFNNDVLISEWVGPDIKNSDEYVIQIDQTSLGLPAREYFLDDSNMKYLEAYRIYMRTIITLLGRDYLDCEQDVEDIIAFETLLAHITAGPETRRNVSDIYRRTTVGGLRALIPQIDWVRYFSMVLDRKMDLAEPVVCFCLDYLKNFVVLMSKTRPRTVANYLLWRFVRHRVNNLDERFQEAKQRFYFILFGREKMPPRWQVCVSQVNSNLGMAVGSMFVQKYFDETSKNDTLQITKQLQQSFKELLNATVWLDNSTKQLAELKIDAMHLRIGYPDFILDPTELAGRYADVNMHPDYYFENMLSILRHLTRVEQARLGTVVNKTLWNTQPAIVNAYYSRNKNQIMFPAGILQPPFYHRHFPHSLNYGGIGVVIGHEITHGFDDKGRLFDKEGNLNRWWEESSIAEFHKRSQCLIEQYNAYTVPEVNMPVDGSSTQGENIADNGGIKQAYRAYMHWLENNPDAFETLPGLDVNKEQLFFLNFAQVWCGTSRPETMKNKLKTAVHAPGRFRVIGTLSNSDDFARVFSCPSGSPMNPEKKCVVW